MNFVGLNAINIVDQITFVLPVHLLFSSAAFRVSTNTNVYPTKNQSKQIDDFQAQTIKA